MRLALTHKCDVTLKSAVLSIRTGRAHLPLRSRHHGSITSVHVSGVNLVSADRSSQHEPSLCMPYVYMEADFGRAPSRMQIPRAKQADSPIWPCCTLGVLWTCFRGDMYASPKYSLSRQDTVIHYHMSISQPCPLNFLLKARFLHSTV